MDMHIQLRGDIAELAPFGEEQLHGGVQRGDQQRCRHRLAGHVGDKHGEDAVAIEEGVVVASHLPGRTGEGGHIDVLHRRNRLRQNVALDRGRQLQLAFHHLFLQRLAMQTRVFQGDPDLVREE